jgi:hypothetical protein
MMKKVITLSLSLATLMVLSGCASLTGGGTAQSVTVLAYTEDGKDVNEAKCEMVNDVGNWSLVTPNTVTVNRSNKDLFVTCKKDSLDKGTANVVSRTKGHLFGNIIFGGGIGAIIDHNNGSAYEYPATVKIVMGKNQRIEDQAQTVESKSDDNKQN